jgi:hypothetical protein
MERLLDVTEGYVAGLGRAGEREVAA